MYYEDYKGFPLLNAGIAFIDIDRFKDVNDLYGHLFGDEVLKGIVQVFLDNTSDAVIRLGGDEFVLIIPNIEEDDFMNLLRKILVYCNNVEFYLNPSYHVTISIGDTMVHNEVLKDTVNRGINSCFMQKNILIPSKKISKIHGLLQLV